jgi:hypothetical protein
MMNSSRAMDSLSTLIKRWHNLFGMSWVGRVGCWSVDVLREEELDLLIRKLAQLGAEHIVDADVICISPGSAESVSGQLCGRM